MLTRTTHVAATERLLLRPLAEDDLPDVGRWLEDQALARAYLVSDEAFGAEDLRGVLDWSRADPRVQAWAIEDRDGALVAGGNSKPDYPFDGVWECEVFLSPALPKGQGYGLEAHHLVVDHVMTTHPAARKVMGRSASFNVAAIRIMEKLGCRPEGRLREQIEIGDERYDLVVCGMLRAEWEATAPAGRRVPW
jgi:RimJ/RimL family protein N-acetyltransferase